MIKKLLIKALLSALIDTLLGIATKKYYDANKEENKRKWLNIAEFLSEVKEGGLP